MKLALVSDIHGNYKALEMFLQFLEKHPVEGVICLGDYVTDSPYPQKTMELLYSMMETYPCYMVRGNREDYLLDNPGNVKGWKPSSSNGTLLYTLQNMTQRDLDYFASIPTERELKLEGVPAVYLCHGVPGRVRGNVHEEKGLREKILKGLPYDFLFGGHSHFQEVYVEKGKTYVNPGSLGFAMDGIGRRAQFALLQGTEEGWRVEFYSLAYDVDAFLADFKISGVSEMGMTLSKAIQKSLLTGRNYFYECILEMDARAKEKGLQSIDLIPEEEWISLEERFGL